MLGFNRFDVTVQIRAGGDQGGGVPIEMRMANASADDLQAIQRFQEIVQKTREQKREADCEKLEISLLLHRFWYVDEGTTGNPNEVSANKEPAGDQPAPEQNEASAGERSVIESAWVALKNSKRTKSDFWTFSCETVSGDEDNASTARLLMSALSGYVILNPELPDDERTVETLRKLLASSSIEDLSGLFYSKCLPDQLKIAADAFGRFSAASPTMQRKCLQLLSTLLQKA